MSGLQYIFQLKERGYTNIDALDGSKGMLEKAKEKNIYQNLIHTLLGPQPIDGIAKGDFLKSSIIITALKP